MSRLAALLTLLCIVGCEPERLVLLGDSHTAGACTDDPCTPFATILEASLSEIYSVEALGFGGYTMFTLGYDEEFFAEEVAPYVAGATVNVMLGTNDVRYAIPVPWFWMATHLIVQNLRDAGAKRVILMPPPPFFTDDGTELLAAYRELILGICESRPDAECGPDPWEFMRERHFVDPEGDTVVHMNQAGHRAMGLHLTWFYWLDHAMRR